jgi:hypothetical protein
LPSRQIPACFEAPVLCGTYRCTAHTAGFPADRLEKIQAAFADFKKEALQRKKAVKTGTASPKEFTDWLYQQSDIILKLTTF